MAHETVTKSNRFYCVSLTPDICKTPVGNAVVPIPYNIRGEFAQAAAVSKDVKTHSEAVFLHGKSYIPSVTGDARGTLGGIKSGTFLRRVESYQFSPTKGSNGTQTIQESRLVWMNNRNTVGRVMERAVQAPRARIKLLGWEVPESVTDAAQSYKDNYSKPLHEFGGEAMDVGGKIGMGSAALGVAGAGVAATGIGLPVAAAMEVGAAAGGVTAAGVAGTGFVADTAATVGDTVADFILSGKSPDLMATAGGVALNAVNNFALKKLTTVGNFAKQLFKKKAVPSKTPAPKPAPPKPPDNSADGSNGGKTKQPKKDKGDKPNDCCNKNGAPGRKKSGSKHPVHYATGEERLQQTDFVVPGATPLAWTRHYRSGSEAEDWGVLGARWATPFTSSLSCCARGIVYHDDSGRALRLPALALGQQQDNRSEGFVLTRDSDSQFTLLWRDGSREVFVRGPDAILPHGYDGVNAMLRPRAPLPVQRFHLARTQGRGGNGTTIERFHDAAPATLLLRVRTDSGVVLEAFRDASDAVRIGHIDEVRPDGTRLCHARYAYQIEAGEVDDKGVALLPPRSLLVKQTNLEEHARSYTYQHCLLVQYTTYNGFAHGLEWVSLASLRDRWAGAGLDDAQLAERHPITAANSYQARAVRTTTADGNDEVLIDYIGSNQTRVTEASGEVLDYYFDDNWLVTEVRRVGPDGKAVSLGRREWDSDGMLLADIDAEANATRYTYDAQGNLASVADARFNTTRFSYDANNQPLTITDALGNTTHHRYDDAGRLVEVIDALGHSTAYAYDADGRLIQNIDALGGTSRLTYDPAGRLVSYTDCSNYSQRYAYDELGRLIGRTDALGNATGYVYDRQSRIAAVTGPDARKETFAYDAQGNLLVHTDATGGQSRYVYNGHNLPVSRTDAQGNTMGYRYDKAMRLVELINANGERYCLTYDLDGQLTSETGFDGKLTVYSYDRAGHLLSSQCNGLRTDYARDALGQLQAKSNRDGVVRYAYDAVGRLTAVATPAAEQRFAYDAVGQLIDERTAYTLEQGRRATFTMTHAFDALGNRIQTTLPDGRRIDTLRYGSGHWHGTLWQGQPLVDVERDQLHREVARQSGTSAERLVARRAYDPQSRLSKFSLAKGQQRLGERLYAYDDAGNLSSVNDMRRGQTRYTYDPLGHMLSAVQPNLTETFAFDPAGNMLDTGVRQEQPLPGSAGVPMAKVTHTLLRQYLGFEYDYDVQGNTVTKRHSAAHSANDAEQLDMVYDADNRLISALSTFKASRQLARYTYDGLGRRIAKQVSVGARDAANDELARSAARTTWFVWDGDMVVQEIHANENVTYLYEPDSFVPLARIEQAEGIAGHILPGTHLRTIDQWQWGTPANDAAGPFEAWQAHREQQAELRHQQWWHERTTGALQPAANDAIQYYQCDQIGTPLELVDEQGALAWSADYKAWGRIARQSGNSVTQPLRFQGQYEDSETGLYYNRFRFYDPDSARYLTQDPIGLVGGDNLYQYAPNSTAWADPLGLAKSKGGCDPCCGKDPSTTARSWQGKWPYPGKDNYSNTVLKKGTVIYTLHPYGPKPGNYFANGASVVASGGNARRYNDLMQVAHLDNVVDQRPMRRELQAFILTKDLCVAKGFSLANPHLGAGGGTQMFIDNADKASLMPSKVMKLKG